MKKNKLIFITALSATCLFSLASCQGAQGPKGDQGTAGINGTNGTDGKDGEDGEDGNSVLTGKGVPASTLGNDGDSYIDTETFDFYVKEDGKWSKEGNIKGSTGDKGETGDTGSKGEEGTSIRTGKGEPSESLGNDGDSYIDLSTFDFYVKSNGKWSNEGNIKGEKGEKGDKGDNGSNGSDGKDGAAGTPGKTAWSSTILPCDHGYVTMNVGSAITGTEVILTAFPDANYKVASFVVNGEEKYTGQKEKGYFDKESKTLTTTMVDNGLVVQALFIKEKEGDKDVVAYDSTGKIYTDLASAIKGDGTENRTVKLVENFTFSGSDGNETAKYSKVKANKTTIDLNGRSLTFGDEKSSSTLSLYGELTITGKGTITDTGKGEPLFELYSNMTSDKQKNFATVLTIGKDVTTKSTSKYAVGIYADDWTKNITLNYSGKDESKKGIVYVNSSVKQEHNVQVNINEASSTGNSLISGYTTLNVTDSTFNVRGTAFNIEAGKINFTKNDFITQLGNDPDDGNKIVKIKTPLFVESSADLTPDWNSTIFMNDDNENTKYGTIKFSENKFYTLYNKEKYTGGKWNDVSFARGIKGSTDVSNVGTGITKTITKDDLKFYITATYGTTNENSFNIYFDTKENAQYYIDYNKDSGVECSAFAQEYGLNVSEFPNLKFSDVKTVGQE